MLTRLRGRPQASHTTPFDTPPWKAAKARFLEGLSPEDMERFRNASPENVFYGASAAQKRHAEQHRSWLMQERLTSLIEGLEDYGKAMDVYANTYSLILAPIWGSLRVILHIAKESGKFQEKLVDMLASIGDALPRFHIYEDLYKDHEKLLQSISDAYLDLLRFCVITKDLFQNANASLFPISIVLKGAWKPFRKQFEEYINMFRRHVKNVEKEARIGHMMATERTRQLQLASQAQEIANRKRECRYRILTSLPVTDYASRYASFASLRHPGTNTWFTMTPEYQTWLSSISSQSLCCFGIPGSGKSVLATSIVEALSTTLSNTVLYYYCDYSDLESLSSMTVVASLLKQMVQRLPSERFDAKFQMLMDDHDSMPQLAFFTMRLTKLLLEIDTVFLVIDGLDQVDGDNIIPILSFINDILREHKDIKVFITSRSEATPIKKNFANTPRIHLQESAVDADISVYTQYKLDELHESHPVSRNSRLRQEVAQALQEGAKGMFLWAKFQMFDILNALTEHAVRRILQELPKNLADTYTNILIRTSLESDGESRVQTMAVVFRWICGSRRPMQLAELEQAIGVDVSDRCLQHDRTATGLGMRIVEQCSNLVVYDEMTATVAFAHHTVQQFIMTTASKGVQVPSALRMDRNSVDTFLAKICLVYLAFSDFETQIVKLVAPVTLTKSEAEQIVWSGVPYIHHMRRLLSWVPARTSKDCNRNTGEIVLATPQQERPPDVLLKKYILLEYIIDYWAYHACVFDPSSEDWPRIQQLVSAQWFVFEHRPWQTQAQMSKVEKVLQLPHSSVGKDRLQAGTDSNVILLYSWALEHGISNVLHLLEDKWAGIYSVLLGPPWDSVDYTKFVKAIQQTPKQEARDVGHGFWNAHSLYTHLLAAKMDVYHEEYRRWSSRHDVFSGIIMDTLLYTIELGDLKTFKRLASDGIKTYVSLTAMLVLMIRANRLSTSALRSLLTLPLDDQINNEVHCELCFVLEKILTAHHHIFPTDPETFERMPAPLRLRLLFVAIVLCPDLQLLKIIPVYNYVEEIQLPETFDWTSTAFGSEESYSKLRMYSVEDMHEAHEALIDHIDILYFRNNNGIRREQKSLHLLKYFKEDDLMALFIPSLVVSMRSARSEDLSAIVKRKVAFREVLALLKLSRDSEELLRVALRAEDEVWTAMKFLPWPRETVEPVYRGYVRIVEQGNLTYRLTNSYKRVHELYLRFPDRVVQT